jgi:lipoate-protein ligase A
MRLASFASAQSGLRWQHEAASESSARGGPLLLAWRSPRALLVGPGDVHLAGLDAASGALAAEGWPVFVRRSGGSACPVCDGTLQIALVRPVGPGVGIDSAYRELAGLIGRALAGFGLVAEIGERPRSFCPGRFDMAVGGRKVAGLSQHWRPAGGRMIATCAASLIVDADADEFIRIVNLFYATAGNDRRCAPGSAMAMRQALPGDVPAGDALLAHLVEEFAHAAAQTEAGCGGQR